MAVSRSLMTVFRWAISSNVPFLRLLQLDYSCLRAFELGRQLILLDLVKALHLLPIGLSFLKLLGDLCGIVPGTLIILGHLAHRLLVDIADGVDGCRLVLERHVGVLPLVAHGEIHDQQQADDDGEEKIQDNEYLADRVHDPSPKPSDSPRAVSRVPEPRGALRRISVNKISPKIEVGVMPTGWGLVKATCDAFPLLRGGAREARGNA